MTLLEYADRHSVDAFILMMVFLFFTYWLIVRLVRFPILWKHGWPPSELDADGDHRTKIIKEKD
jgi:hypothetical protein